MTFNKWSYKELLHAENTLYVNAHFFDGFDDYSFERILIKKEKTYAQTLKEVNCISVYFLLQSCCSTALMQIILLISLWKPSYCTTYSTASAQQRCFVMLRGVSRLPQNHLSKMCVHLSRQSGAVSPANADSRLSPVLKCRSFCVGPRLWAVVVQGSPHCIDCIDHVVQFVRGVLSCGKTSHCLRVLPGLKWTGKSCFEKIPLCLIFLKLNRGGS